MIDVLRRELGVRPTRKSQKPRRRSNQKMTTAIRDGELRVEFEDGPWQAWRLPSRQNREAIKEVRDAATAFARAQGATDGQVAAVMKALTSNEYYVQGKRPPTPER